MSETVYVQHPCIYVQHLWKIKDISTGFKYHLEASMAGKILIILGRLAGILSLILNYALLYRPIGLKAFLDILIIIACLFLDKILIYIFSHNYRRKNYENRQIEWEISNDKIIDRMINLYETSMDWDLIQKVLDTPEYFLIYPQEHMFYLLPKYAFKSEEDIAQFISIAQNKAKNWQQIE